RGRRGRRTAGPVRHGRPAHPGAGGTVRPVRDEHPRRADPGVRGLPEGAARRRPGAAAATHHTMTQAPYDAIADWYEREFLATQSTGDPIGISEALVTLLGPGRGRCLELGCGTDARAAVVRALGWTPLGADLSAGMLRHSRGRLPAMRADASRLPVRDGSVDAVITVMAHTDMPDYPAVLREAARVLRNGGSLIHVGVHPAFCGGFADRSDPEAVVIRP